MATEHAAVELPHEPADRTADADACATPGGDDRGRVLHVLDEAGGECAVLACLHAMEASDAAHTVVLLAGSDGAQAAAALGLCADIRLAPPLGVPELAARALRRALRRRRYVCDVVQAWSLASLETARLAWSRPPRVGCVLTPPPPPDHADFWTIRRLAAVEADSPTIVAVGHALRQRWEDRLGTPVGGYGVRSVDLPPLPYAHAQSHARAASSAQRDTTPGREVVVGLLADPPSAGDARGFVFMLGLLATLGANVAGIVPAGCGEFRRAAAFVRQHGRRWSLSEWDGPFTSLIPHLDVAVWFGDDAAGPLAAAAAAARVPVVAPPTDLAREALPNNPPECVALNSRDTAMCGRLMPLVDDPALRARVGEASVDAVARPGPAATMGDELATIWMEVAEAARVG